MRYFIRVGLALIRLSSISPPYVSPHWPNGGETFINERIISSGWGIPYFALNKMSFNDP